MLQYQMMNNKNKKKAKYFDCFQFSIYFKQIFCFCFLERMHEGVLWFFRRAVDAFWGKFYFRCTRMYVMTLFFRVWSRRRTLLEWTLETSLTGLSANPFSTLMSKLVPFSVPIISNCLSFISFLDHTSNVSIGEEYTTFSFSLVVLRLRFIGSV